jgi:putative ATPase
MRKSAQPLAFRIRPISLDNLIGQAQAKKYITDFQKGAAKSAILWGPPGSGKTTVATIISNLFPERFNSLSAVTSGLQELRKVTGDADNKAETPIVFIDEIHRYNKAQQDALLPHVESGRIIFIGATTENPSFSIISPLLSRARVVVLKSLSTKEILTILERALTDESLKTLGKEIEPDALASIASAADGDARAALNLLEFIVTRSEDSVIRKADLAGLLERPLYHDRMGDYHYDLISAFHKCVRASDVDASVYWLARMMEAGEDRLYILRRMIRMASEDIGMADPNALRMVMAARDAFTSVGMPEADIALYQAAVYLALAPKSNALYIMEMKAKKLIAKTGTPPVPLAIRNAPTKLMQELGYAKGYAYAPDDPLGALQMEYMPEGLEGTRLYNPGNEGFEKRLKEIIDARNKAKRAASGQTRRPD